MVQPQNQSPNTPDPAPYLGTDDLGQGDFFEDLKTLEERGLFSSLNIQRQAADGGFESLGSHNRAYTFDEFRRNFGVGIFNLLAYRKGGGITLRANKYRVGDPGRMASPAVPAQAQAQAPDLAAMVREQLQAALASLGFAPQAQPQQAAPQLFGQSFAPPGFISAAELDRRLKEAEERAEKKAAEAAEKARNEARIQELQRQVEDLKTRPASSPVNPENRDLVTGLVNKLVELGQKRAESSSEPPQKPVDQLRETHALVKEFVKDVSPQAAPGAGAAELVRAITEGVAPVMANISSGVMEMQKLRFAMEEKKLEREYAAQAHREKLELQRMALFPQGQLTPIPDQPAPNQAALPAPQAEPAQDPETEEADMAEPVRVFVAALIDKGQEGLSPRDCLREALRVLHAEYDDHVLDQVLAGVEQVARLDFTNPENTRALGNWLKSNVPLVKRPLVAAGMASKPAREYSLQIMREIVWFIDGVKAENPEAVEFLQSFVASE